MFSPWPGLAPPVIVPGYVLRIRAWASEHKYGLLTLDSQHGQQQLRTNILIITIFWSQLPWSLINLPNARGVWLHCYCYLLQLWEHLVNGHGRADFQRHRYKVTGMIYATSPGSKSLVFSSSDAKAKSTWRVKDNEKEEARQGYGKHLDISRVQFFKSGMGVQQGWVLFRQLCKRPLFENLWCQLSMSIILNLQNLRILLLLLSPSSVLSSWVHPTLRDQEPPSSSPALA